MEDFPRANIRRALLEDTERAEEISKAAWQLEDAMVGRVVRDYPSDQEAREAYFDWAKSNQMYTFSVILLYFISMVEVPSWCNTHSSFWTWMAADERCQVRGVKQEDLLLSTVPYLPPGVTLVLEGILVYQIALELLQRRHLQVQYFGPLQVEYFGPNNDMKVTAGLVMVAFEVIDMAVFILWRTPFRVAFVSRTAFMVFMPAVLKLFDSIVNVITEFVTIAIFFVSGIVLFAWVATMIFDDSAPQDIYGESVTKGFDSFPQSMKTMFVAGSTDDFFECFRNTYASYRSTGFLWLLFLVIVHVLLLSLVLDTLVACYKKYNDRQEDWGLEDKVHGISTAFETLAKATGDGTEVSKDAFMEFAAEYSRSPRAKPFITEEQADIIFKVIDQDDTQTISKEEFFRICGAMRMKITVTQKWSPVKDVFPKLWNHPVWAHPVWGIREQIDSGNFDKGIMNAVLMTNLILVCVETWYDLNKKLERPWTKKLEIIFSFTYVTECGLKLCVWSWQEYFCSLANRFDFVTTWLLLGSSLLEEIAGSAGSLKRYMNVLRLLRLVRVIKQLTRRKKVIFMINTIARLVGESRDILCLLLVVVYFFTMLSVQLFGGLLYKTNEHLEESEYAEAKFWVLNFNDFLMAFGAWVVMLLCEFKAEFADAIKRTSAIPGGQMIFYIFYVFAVSIIFELVKAFTIEVFVSLHEENREKEKKKKLKKKKRKKEREEREKLEREEREKMEKQGEPAEASDSQSGGWIRSFFVSDDKDSDADEEEEEEGEEGFKEMKKDYLKKGQALHIDPWGDPELNVKILKQFAKMEKEEGRSVEGSQEHSDHEEHSTNGTHH